MNNNQTICYTGFNSVKSGNHTKKKYLEIMDRNFKKECSVYMKSLKCKSCKKSIEMNTKEGRKQLKNKSYKMSKKTEDRLVKQISICKRCKNNKTKKCNLNNYILFSGAEIGKCEKI
jgi:hypothetical protein